MLEPLIETLTNPLVILGIGLVTVIGMIIVLRVNAFIALITAAILVSLLAPGDLAEKVARVAEAFGTFCGKIGIVIAMAAVIGKCLMDSGAADRIVRSFLKVMGEKRAPEAMMGASFVLAVPVFFDTVFYLMVPLARSLWRSTRKNYMLYILAIATGGVITHGLVPPTPGPLLMAANLDIDIGVMILVGALIGAPAAVVGLLSARVLNRLMDVPCRPYSGEPEPEPLEDSQLPSLAMSLAPILLPVILISAKTVTETLAEAERESLVAQGDVFEWSSLHAALVKHEEPDAGAPVRRIVALLPEGVRTGIDAWEPGEAVNEDLLRRLKEATGTLAREQALAIDDAMVGVALPKPAVKLLDDGLRKLSEEDQQRFEGHYQAKAHQGVATSTAARALIEQGLGQLSEEDRTRFNWYLLEAAFAGQVKQTSRQQAAEIAALLGDPNLALLISGAIAMFVLVRKRKLTRVELAKALETALMSGGVIILITAAGGAFGAMLKEAQVGPAIEQMFQQESTGAGVMLLVMGFGVAALLKIAQGSSTVAMITASAMLASMGATPEVLGFHPVYLATAIAGGSLICSWMNDSGFWIFARMSGLTEIETLKSWTIQLVVLGVTIFALTLAAVWVFPMA